MVNEMRRSGPVSPVLVVVSAIAIALGACWLYFANQPRNTATPAAITAEGKQYVKNLQLSGVDMKASENFAGADLVEITGNLKNAGDRSLQRVDLTCVFYDPTGQQVFRERVPVLRAALKPGETRSFRLPFEGIPETWNQTMPQLVIAQVAFE